MSWRRMALAVNVGSLLLLIVGVAWIFSGMAAVTGLTLRVVAGAFLVLIGFWGVGSAWGWTEGYAAGVQFGARVAFAVGRETQQWLIEHDQNAEADGTLHLSWEGDRLSVHYDMRRPLEEEED